MGEHREGGRLARVVGGMVAVAVVAGAAAGGWFGYGHLTAESNGDPSHDVGSARTPTQGTAGSPPWPADLPNPITTWASFRMGWSPDDIVRHQVEFDAPTNRSRQTFWNSDGIEIAWAEALGRDVWWNDGDGWERTPVDAEDTAKAAYLSTPPTVRSLLPPSIWPYTTLASDTSVGDTPGVRRLEFSIDARSYSAENPIDAVEWQLVTGDVDRFELTVWTIDVDANGSIVRFDPGGSFPVGMYSELPEAVEFESPLGG